MGGRRKVQSAGDEGRCRMCGMTMPIDANGRCLLGHSVGLAGAKTAAAPQLWPASAHDEADGAYDDFDFALLTAPAGASQDPQPEPDDPFHHPYDEVLAWDGAPAAAAAPLWSPAAPAATAVATLRLPAPPAPDLPPLSWDASWDEPDGTYSVLDVDAASLPLPEVAAAPLSAAPERSTFDPEPEAEARRDRQVRVAVRAGAVAAAGLVLGAVALGGGLL